ncbi:4-(cytidine 5'-diphospho)-2-C-methyl-D-erythritol kinase [Sphingobacterium kyonggiense]|uniref:4-diphosphocytidyl-2-C-methyl-D-erythritol kinase n=1 Tax=Sphingobacterium kyonggiense TaxID=714075 RepID=A0ABP7YU06_9SPHI
MLKFANAKINIGLHITRKREDGYHDLETIFYPVKLYDVIEVRKAEEMGLSIWNSSLVADADNLCLRAYNLLKTDYEIPLVHIDLLKNIPIGAGLGGGSSDATAVLGLLNDMFELNISTEKLKEYAAQLGADCSFFVENKAQYAEGIGTQLKDIELDLSAYHIVLVKPDIHISTAEAYRAVIPQKPEIDLRDAVKLPIQEWKYTIRNDFEFSLFEKYPLIRDIKSKLYELGAVYASMSGSGSSVFGLFEDQVDLSDLNKYAEVYPATEL